MASLWGRCVEAPELEMSGLFPAVHYEQFRDPALRGVHVGLLVRRRRGDVDRGGLAIGAFQSLPDGSLPRLQIHPFEENGSLMIGGTDQQPVAVGAPFHR